MTKADRDRLFELMVFFDELNNWLKDKTSEISDKDRSKIKIINDMIMAMLIQYRKREGEEAFKTFMEEAKKYKLLILPVTEEVEPTGTFEMEIIKSAIKKVLPLASECGFCERKDCLKCEWYTLNKFMETPQTNKNKGQCPYKADFSALKI